MGDPAGGGGGFAEGGPGQRKEIYTYKAPWTVFSMSWSRRYVYLLVVVVVVFVVSLCG
jgi:hypothetical protein